MRLTPGRKKDRMITIRDATEADLPAIVHIYNSSIPGGRSTADTKSIAVDDRVEWSENSILRNG